MMRWKLSQKTRITRGETSQHIADRTPSIICYSALNEQYLQPNGLVTFFYRRHFAFVCYRMSPNERNPICNVLLIKRLRERSAICNNCHLSQDVPQIIRLKMVKQSLSKWEYSVNELWSDPDWTLFFFLLRECYSPSWTEDRLLNQVWISSNIV